MSFWINFILTFFKRKKWLSLGVLLAVSILALSGYFYLKMDKQVKVKEGIVGTHEERDLPETVLNLISKPLIKIDKSGNPVPELIQSWEISNEGKVYSLKLKPDLSWSDGRKVKASEIYISIADVEITAPDDQTLEFKLAEAFSPFPTLLNKPILRKAPVEFGFELVGVGPYKVLNKKKDGPVVKKTDFDIADKSFPRVSVTFFPNEKIAKTALKLGEVQSLLGVIEPDDLNFNNLAKKELTNFNQLVTIFLNTEDPLLSDENLRLSLAYSAPEFANAEIARMKQLL